MFKTSRNFIETKGGGGKGRGGGEREREREEENAVNFRLGSCDVGSVVGSQDRLAV